MSRPAIGVTSNLFPAEPRHSYQGKEIHVADRCMVESVARARGVPLVLPISTDAEVRQGLLDRIDGLLLTAGADVDPASYGSSDRRWPGQPERDAFELWMLEAARAKGLPVLAICRGIQLLNVGFGGTLIPDIQTERPACHTHRDKVRYDTLRHPVRLKPGTLLSELFGSHEQVQCNSVHHQAIDVLGTGLEAVAWSDDGLIEAVTAPADAWTWGVQWHPEWDPTAPHTGLFRRFVEVCG